MIAPQLSLSTTGFGDASLCLKKYQYHFVDHLVPRPRSITKPMRRGIWAHRCLQDYHSGKDWRVSLEGLMTWAIQRGVDSESVDSIAAETTALMLGYIAHWSADNWTPLYSEHMFTARGKLPTGEDVEIRATVDLIADIPGQGRFLVEHKTTASIPPSSWRCVDPQTALQWVTATQNGVQLDGILFNYLLTTPPSVPRIKKDGEFYANTAVTTGEAYVEAIHRLTDEQFTAKAAYYEQMNSELVDDGKFYQRHYTFRGEQIAETGRDVQATIENILHARQTGHYPRSFHIMSCQRFCPYGELCVTEYMTGKKAETMREEMYMIDDGTREGQS